MSRLPDPWPSLLRRIERIEEWMSREGASSKFAGTPLRPQEDGSMAVDARLSVTTGEVQSGDFVTGSKGWHLGHDGKAEFKDVTLYDIPNSMLANPLAGSTPNASASGFSLAQNSLTELAGVNITVPDGFTRCFAAAASTVFAYNPRTTGGSNGAGGDAIYAMVQLGGQVSHANPVGVSGSGGYATSFSNAGFSLSDLIPGSTIRLAVYGTAAYQTLAGNPDNYANANAAIFWLR